MMTTCLLDHFSVLDDPRQSWQVCYPLEEVLLIVLCATMAGAEDFVQIERWGNRKLDFPRRFLPFAKGVPSHDTLNAMIARVEAEVECDGKTSSERRDFLSSAKPSAKRFATAVRAHWHIENRLHWVMDVVFHDDLMRPRTDNGPANMAAVKHMSLNGNTGKQGWPYYPRPRHLQPRLQPRRGVVSGGIKARGSGKVSVTLSIFTRQVRAAGP